MPEVIIGGESFNFEAQDKTLRDSLRRTWDMLRDRYLPKILEPIKDGHETHSVQWWTYIINNFYRAPEYHVACEGQPGGSNDLRRVNFVVKEFEERERALLTVFFLKAKRAISASGDKISEVESQAFSAAYAHLTEQGKDRDNMWTISCVSTGFRLWVLSIREQNFSLPVCPKNWNIGERGGYLDFNSPTVTEYIYR